MRPNACRCVSISGRSRAGEKDSRRLASRVDQLQEFQLRAIENDAYVEEFFPVYSGNNADDGVFKQVLVLHAGLLL
jgi:hypothetical protein